MATSVVVSATVDARGGVGERHQWGIRKGHLVRRIRPWPVAANLLRRLHAGIPLGEIGEVGNEREGLGGGEAGANGGGVTGHASTTAPSPPVDAPELLESWDGQSMVGYGADDACRPGQSVPRPLRQCHGPWPRRSAGQCALARAGGTDRRPRADDIQYTWLGPCHFGGNISGPYADGRRVIWSNGRETIAKLDYETLEVLAEHEIVGGSGVTPREVLQANLAGLDEKDGWEAIEHGIDLSLRYMTGLDGVYSLLDCDHTFFLGRKDHAVAYVNADPDEPASAIVERDRWDKPDHIEGFSSGSTSPSTAGWS